MNWYNQLKGYSHEQLVQLKYSYAPGPKTMAIQYFLDFAEKRVTVVKGRKVPIGTTGKCFWIGSTCYSPHGDPWGIYTQFRVGIRTDNGDVYWTNADNIIAV